jgi:hypothetical protein
MRIKDFIQAVDDRTKKFLIAPCTVKHIQSVRTVPLIFVCARTAEFWARTAADLMEKERILISATLKYRQNS